MITNPSCTRPQHQRQDLNLKKKHKKLTGNFFETTKVENANKKIKGEKTLKKTETAPPNRKTVISNSEIFETCFNSHNTKQDAPSPVISTAAK